MKRRRCSWCGKLFYIKEDSKAVCCCKKCERKASKTRENIRGTNKNDGKGCNDLIKGDKFES
ncbi:MULTISPECIES: hypothetical protein [Clostridioides]|uniref:hypothetical protein n=1 Tax=Clostridioides sp. ZZV14-6387 TaxID=2811497 RepID=UPI0007BC1FC3|nr:hypothetical protein [Clostridioides sp. ZZV14-6387]CZR96237.1 hypothetical protein CDFC105_61027 [Clostridioides difficile]CZS08096.1 hypothetical protein CDFC105_72680 [Clostridioides difficile]